MSWLSQIVKPEQRDSLETPSQAFLDFVGGGPTYSGKSVTVDSALKLVPVWSAINLLAGTVGSLPLIVYRRLEEGRERARDHRAWKLVSQPNPEMAGDEMWELVTTHLLLWGNAFIAKIRLGDKVTELWPIRPDRVKVGKDSRERRYFILDDNPKRYYEDDILHIRGLGTDGLVGLSPIQQCRQALASGMALEEFTGSFWGNSANPGGILTHPNRLSPDAKDRLRQEWKSKVGGSMNAGETAVLEEGMKWEQVGMPLEDAQFIETSQFNNLQIALMFRVPPNQLGASSGDSLTYSTIEGQGLNFLTYSVRRWLVRIENSLFRDPSLFIQGDRFYPEFLVDALLRADSKTRNEAYAIGVTGGWLSVDEVRERENLNPADKPDPPPPPPPPDEGESLASRAVDALETFAARPPSQVTVGDTVVNTPDVVFEENSIRSPDVNIAEGAVQVRNETPEVNVNVESPEVTVKPELTVPKRDMSIEYDDKGRPTRYREER